MKTPLRALQARLLTSPVPAASDPTPLIHYIETERVLTARADEVQLHHLEHAEAAREIRMFPNQRHTPGIYWSATENKQLTYESDLERRWMTTLDFDPDVVAFSAQPCLIRGRDGGDPWTHYPDVFARLKDGTGWLIDVVNPGRRRNNTAVQLTLDRTAAFCEDAGLRYSVLEEPDPIVWSNVAYLAAYRRRLAALPGLESELLAAAAAPTTVGELINTHPAPELARPVAMSLMWRHAVLFDTDRLLDDHTTIYAPTHLQENPS
jgi:hypothetical protein